MAISKMVENGGKGNKPMAMSKALEAVGYSPTYAHNPQKFLKTKVAKDLLQEYLPDELIAQKHRELLEAAEIQHYYFPKIYPAHNDKESKKGKSKTKVGSKELTNTEIKAIVESVAGCHLIYIKRDRFGAYAYFQAPDTRSQKEAIDMAYKRKGDYAAEKVELTKRKYQDLSNADLLALEIKLKKFLTKK